MGREQAVVGAAGQRIAEGLEVAAQQLFHDVVQGQPAQVAAVRHQMVLFAIAGCVQAHDAQLAAIQGVDFLRLVFIVNAHFRQGQAAGDGGQRVHALLVADAARIVGRLLGQADAVAGRHVHVDPGRLAHLAGAVAGVAAQVADAAAGAARDTAAGAAGAAIDVAGAVARAATDLAEAAMVARAVFGAVLGPRFAVIAGVRAAVAVGGSGHLHRDVVSDLLGHRAAAAAIRARHLAAAIAAIAVAADRAPAMAAPAGFRGRAVAGVAADAALAGTVAAGIEVPVLDGVRQVDARRHAVVGLVRLAQGVVELGRGASQAFLFLRVSERSHLVQATLTAAILSRWREVAVDDALLEARFQRIVRLQRKILQDIFLGQRRDVVRFEARLVLHQGAQLAQHRRYRFLCELDGRWRRHGRLCHRRRILAAWGCVGRFSAGIHARPFALWKDV